MLWLYILIGIIIILVIWGVIIYNNLINLKNLADEGWSGIDVQLKKRYDLVPNLVNTVKGYASFEQKTLERVIEKRNQAVDTSGVEQKAQKESELTDALRQLFALSENYPELKANQSYLKLQEELTEIEDTVSKARRYYNGTVRNLNIQIQSFPSNLIANQFSFKIREYFEAESGEKENIEVNV